MQQVRGSSLQSNKVGLQALHNYTIYADNNNTVYNSTAARTVVVS